jgi:hypothetical protein
MPDNSWRRKLVSDSHADRNKHSYLNADRDTYRNGHDNAHKHGRAANRDVDQHPRAADRYTDAGAHRHTHRNADRHAHGDRDTDGDTRAPNPDSDEHACRHQLGGWTLA